MVVQQLEEARFLEVWSRAANLDLLQHMHSTCRVREQEEANIDGTGAGGPGKAYPLGGKASQDAWGKGGFQPYPPQYNLSPPPMAPAIAPAQAIMVDPSTGQQIGPPPLQIHMCNNIIMGDT